jgi:putative heme-binding domain-containing protein
MMRRLLTAVCLAMVGTAALMNALRPCQLEAFGRGGGGPAAVAGLRVPDGFEVVEFADAKLANDIYCMTIDPKGRIVVSGRGYIKILVDDRGQGHADRAILFSDRPKDGAMGLLWEGDSLFATGDGGLRQFKIVDGDHAAGPPALLRALRTGGEHDAHAILRGPDGWLYLLCGNTAGVNGAFADLPGSPIKGDPVAGCVVRFDPEFSGSEIVADGFRNPYGMDFNPDGELFTWDSDNERCVSLPWYEGTRFCHVIGGGHYGWTATKLEHFWRKPPYFIDVVGPVVDLGRGSPTAVTCYRHVQFPAKYRGGFFCCDWTFGRIWHLRLTRSGTSYVAEKELFLEATGDNGFAPTACVVHPDTGDLYVATGGRGSRGAVYRIRWPGGTAGASAAAAAKLQPVKREIDRTNAWQRAEGDVLTAWRKVEDAPREAMRMVSAGLEDPRTTLGQKLGFLRIAQLALGDLGFPALEGTVLQPYSPRHPAMVGLRKTEPEYPEFCRQLDRLLDDERGERDLRRELGRTVALARYWSPKVARFLAHRLVRDSDPTEDIHFLAVLARLGPEPCAALRPKVADALLTLERRLDALNRNRDTNWPLRLDELYRELVHQDGGLTAAILRHPEMGRPEHVAFTEVPGFDRKAAAALFLEKIDSDSAFHWNAGVVALVVELPGDEITTRLRRIWGKAGVDAAILPVLARKPLEADRPKFIEGLASTNLATVRVCLETLQKIGVKGDPIEAGALIRALDHLPESREGKELRKVVGARLEASTGKQFGLDRAAWIRWYEQTAPTLAARLTNPDGVDVAAWGKRLAGLSWTDGIAERGHTVFIKANCAACHSGAAALGPDLSGAGKRFSRDDLFTAIVQPSRDVADRYRTTVIETTAGKVYQGVIVYEAIDSLILHTGPATTVRIDVHGIAARATSRISLMPAGLLDHLTDQEIVDLYAYLQTR